MIPSINEGSYGDMMGIDTDITRSKERGAWHGIFISLQRETGPRPSRRSVELGTEYSFHCSVEQVHGHHEGAWSLARNIHFIAAWNRSTTIISLKANHRSLPAIPLSPTLLGIWPPLARAFLRLDGIRPSCLLCGCVSSSVQHILL